MFRVIFAVTLSIGGEYMINRPFSFYFNNSEGISKVLGIKPVGNNYRYLIKDATGNLEDKNNPIKIEVFKDGEPLNIEGGFSFILRYADANNEQFELTVHVKKNAVISSKSSNARKLHLYTD
jgi:hypothetical protein